MSRVEDDLALSPVASKSIVSGFVLEELLEVLVLEVCVKVFSNLLYGRKLVVSGHIEKIKI
jgi:hypothetical protein